MRVHPQSIREFPNCPKEVPDELLSEDRAMWNHSQTLARLNERGGLGIMEILDNIHDRKLSFRDETESDLQELLTILEKHKVSKENPPERTFTLQEAQDIYYRGWVDRAKGLGPTNALNKYFKEKFNIDLDNL